MAKANPLLESIAATLDGVNVAMCVFNDDDEALLWNRSFLEFFPEHANDIHVGEPYRLNLRRFYEGRLDQTELPLIDQYIEEGILRHRAQQRPFTFEHHGHQLVVSSLVLPDIGRIRIWRRQERSEPPNPVASNLGQAAQLTRIEGTAVFDHIADGVTVLDANNRIAWANRPFVLMYLLVDANAAIGLTLEQAYRCAWQGKEDDDRVRFDQGLLMFPEVILFDGASFEMPLPGARFVRLVGQRGSDGLTYFVHADITALKRQQERLQQAEQRLRDSEAVLAATLDRMEQGIMMVNAEGIVEVCNRRAVELLGLPEQLMASRPTYTQVLEFQWSTDEYSDVSDELKRFIRSGGILDGPPSYDRKRPDGRVIEVHSVPIEGGGVLRTYTDITERKKQEERIRHIARHDGLTSLVTRDVFMEHLQAAVEDRKAGKPAFAVLYIDLDRFKPINDAYGHAIGDKALAQIAERMRYIVRDGDVVGRMGGDEFAILQYRADDAEKALKLARRLLEGVGVALEIAPHRITVGASIGVAIYQDNGCDAETLLTHADKAMYVAKSEGRDCIKVYDASIMSDSQIPIPLGLPLG